MSQVEATEKALPTLVACSMIVVGTTTGHVLIGICFAAVAFLGLVMCTLSRTRLSGGLIFLAGVFAFGGAVLFTTGQSLGKDMALRDAAHAHSSPDTSGR
ncbi:hypothetical protein [Rhodanobacter sp. Root627]|uniref:hypothetical protein n=1 Tax=Rhodanobacter sp. Root627 TaxID=1736572 RepID=UPI0012E39250|nr:hypothetical protein [Rhodanobacter sp. Root627]